MKLFIILIHAFAIQTMYCFRQTRPETIWNNSIRKSDRLFCRSPDLRREAACLCFVGFTMSASQTPQNSPKPNLGTIFERPFSLTAEQARKWKVMLPSTDQLLISGNLTLQNNTVIINDVHIHKHEEPKKERKTSTNYLDNSVSSHIDRLFWTAMQYYILYLFFLVFSNFFIK